MFSQQPWRGFMLLLVHLSVIGPSPKVVDGTFQGFQDPGANLHSHFSLTRFVAGVCEIGIILMLRLVFICRQRQRHKMAAGFSVDFHICPALAYTLVHPLASGAFSLGQSFYCLKYSCFSLPSSSRTVAAPLPHGCYSSCSIWA